MVKKQSKEPKITKEYCAKMIKEFDSMVKDINPKARDAFFKEVKDMVSKAFLNDHEFPAAIIFQDKEHLFGKVGIMQFESLPEDGDDKAKIMAFAGTKLAIIAPGTQFFCFAAEAWMTRQDKIRPSKSDDKEEVLVLSANDLLMNTNVVTYKIIRRSLDGKEMIDLKEITYGKTSNKWNVYEKGFQSRLNKSLIMAFTISTLLSKTDPKMSEESIFEIVKHIM